MALKAVAAPLGSPVGGSGTANTIPRWGSGSPSTTLTDSGLIDDSTSIYTSTRRVGVDTSTTLANVKFQVGSASALSNYQGAPVGFILPTGNGTWMEFAENSTNGTSFRISKDSTTGVLFNANGKDIGFVASGYQTFVSSSQLVLKTSGNVGIGTASPASRLDVAGTITCDDAGTGLKLPATPGNGNANTLDSYQEGTRVLSAGDLSGWTYVTATQYWTLVGRTVTLHTVFTGGTSSATGGATIATPPLLTPLRIAAGAAVNSSGTALGNGVCVVTSTSSTTGTVITSSAISSSAVDKVITVTYETAGL